MDGYVRVALGENGDLVYITGGQSNPWEAPGTVKWNEWDWKLIAKVVGSSITLAIAEDQIQAHYPTALGWGLRNLFHIVPWFVAILGFSAVFRTSQTSVSRSDFDSMKEELESGLEELEGWIAVQEDVIHFHRIFASSIDNVVTAEDSNEASKNLIRALLIEAGRILYDRPLRSYVLIPEPDCQYLTPFITEQLPEPHGYERRFYIGPDTNRKRGVAGHAFVLKSVEVARYRDDTEAFDHPEYVELDHEDRTKQYGSFIAVPILRHDIDCLGVLCIDSEDRTTFDDDAVQALISSLGSVIGNVLHVAEIGASVSVTPIAPLPSDVAGSTIDQRRGNFHATDG